MILIKQIKTLQTEITSHNFRFLHQQINTDFFKIYGTFSETLNKNNIKILNSNHLHSKRRR